MFAAEILGEYLGGDEFVQFSVVRVGVDAVLYFKKLGYSIFWPDGVQLALSLALILSLRKGLTMLLKTMLKSLGVLMRWMPRTQMGLRS